MGRHSWSAMQQHHYLQSAVGQGTNQLCQQTEIVNVRHRLWLSTGTQVGVSLSPSLLAGTAMTLCSVQVIHERTLSSREVKTWLSDCGVDHDMGVNHKGSIPVK